MIANPALFNRVDLSLSDNSDFWKGALKGALIGGVVLTVIALVSCRSDDSLESRVSRMWLSCGHIVILSAATGVVMGGLIGGIIELIF